MRTVAGLLLSVTLGLLPQTGCRQSSQPPPQEAATTLEGVRVLIVVPPRDFRRTIYDAVTEALEEAGATFDLCSVETGKAVGTQGRSIDITLTPETVDPQDYQAVVFIGGPGMRGRVEDPDFIDLAKTFYEADTVLAAIRFSPAILANADLLNGKTVTAGDTIRPLLESKGAKVTSNPVEVDGRIITGQGPEASKEFAQTLVDVLRSRARR